MTNLKGFELDRGHKHFGGATNFYKHDSKVCNAPMNFAVYLPPAALNPGSRKFPVLYWLSGLTCTPEIFMTEAHAQGLARKHEMILVAPDTSPRQMGIEGESDVYSLGVGASFYVDATESPWSRHFQMYTYVTRELRELVEASLPIDPARRGISGHSMGGHGALVLGLRNPELYRSISAFAPISAPSHGPWGQAAFTAYLGADRGKWAAYDSCELLKTARGKTPILPPILIDQGTDDEFLEKELLTDQLERAIAGSGHPAKLRRQAGYDHSYFFVSSFLEDHLAFHAEILKP